MVIDVNVALYLVRNKLINCDNNNNTFCKAFNVVYYNESSICNLGYVGQTSNTLNVKINEHIGEIKNCKKKKNNNHFEIKHFHFQDFNKINLYIYQ